MNAQAPLLMNLLGMAPIQPEAQPSKPAVISEAGVFNLIFQSFLASPTAPTSNGMPETSSVEGLQPTPDTNNVDQGDAQVIQTVATNPQPLGLEGLANVFTNGQLGSNDFGSTNDSANAAQQRAFPSAISQRIIEATIDKLPQGTFDVAAMTVTDGIVSFDVTSPETDQTIRITIPLDTISRNIDPNNRFGTKASQSHRAILNDSIDLESLLNRAEVTSITIQNSAAGDNNANNGLPAFTINATEHGKSLSLFGSPRPAEIVAQFMTTEEVTPEMPKQGKFRTTLFNEPAEEQIVSPQTLEEKPENASTNFVRPMLAGELPTSDAKMKVSESSDDDPTLPSTRTSESPRELLKVPQEELATETQSQQDIAHSVLDADTAPVVENSRGLINISPTPHSNSLNDSGSTSWSNELHTASKSPISVPRNFEAMMSHSGTAKSVTLQLNPEHLGSARVHLSVQDDMVSARVIVDSHQAKAAVEGSLSDLLTQFERANIRVEQIHVAVSGEWQNAEHNRRQFWQAPRPAARISKDNDADTESVTSKVARLFTPNQSPALAGLNILA